MVRIHQRALQISEMVSRRSHDPVFMVQIHGLPFFCCMQKIIIKDVLIIIKINKNEMEFLVKNGVPIGEDGISHSVARHRRTYYMCESVKNMKLHNKYQKSITK